MLCYASLAKATLLDEKKEGKEAMHNTQYAKSNINEPVPRPLLSSQATKPDQPVCIVFTAAATAAC
jgi:hypothetical protein